MRASALFIVLLLVLLLPRSALAAGRLVTVAMDVRGFDDEAYSRLGLLSLQRQLALRLTQTGFAVVGLHKAPQLSLAFRAAAGGLRLQVKVSPRRQTYENSAHLERGRGDLDTFHLEVIHRTMALLRQAAAALPPPRQPSSQPSSRPTSRSNTALHPQVAPQPASSSWGVELSGGGMALYRPGGVDLLLRGSGRLGIHRGLGLRGAISISPYLGSADLTVVELGVQVGSSWRFQLTRRLHLEPGILVGVLQHIHDQVDAGLGLEWDFLGSLSVELGLRLHRYLGLRLWLAPGFTTQPREHMTGWRREIFRLEAGVLGVLILR